MRGTLNQLGEIFRAWPIRPLPLAILQATLILLTNSTVLVALALSEDRDFVMMELVTLIPSVVLGFFIALSALLTFRYLSLRFERLAGLFYWLGALSFGLSTTVAREITAGEASLVSWSDPRVGLGSFIGPIVVYLVFNVSAGLVNQRLVKQVELAQAANAALETQRNRVISAGEDARKQVADFLHDRLQSDLVLLGLQMQRSLDRFGPDGKPVAKAFIEEIERIRQVDVRNISKQLAPELDGPSLKPAIEDLLERYQKVLKTSIEITETGELLRSVKLACYRIIEQAVLNASKHGAASQVEVKLTEFESFVEIQVWNDGHPLPPNPSPGTGFAVFDDWTEQHRGNWEIRPKGNGTVLLVQLSKPGQPS